MMQIALTKPTEKLNRSIAIAKSKVAEMATMRPVRIGDVRQRAARQRDTGPVLATGPAIYDPRRQASDVIREREAVKQAADDAAE